MEEQKIVEKSNYYIIPEWKRSKDAIIDSYLLTINSMSEVIPKWYTRKIIIPHRLDDWKKGIVALFYQIKEHEKVLSNIDDIQKRITNISELEKFTNLIFATKTLKDIKAISRNKDCDPIIEYKKEAYK